MRHEETQRRDKHRALEKFIKHLEAIGTKESFKCKKKRRRKEKSRGVGAFAIGPRMELSTLWPRRDGRAEGNQFRVCAADAEILRPL